MTRPFPFFAFSFFAIGNFLLLISPMFIMPVLPFGAKVDLIAHIEAHRAQMVASHYIGVLQLATNLVATLLLAVATRNAEEESGPGGYLWILLLGSAACAGAVNVGTAAPMISQPFLLSVGADHLTLLNQLGLHAFSIGYIVQVILVATVAIAILKHRFVPVLFGWLAVLVTILVFMATWGVIFTEGPFAAQALLPTFIAAFSFPVWLALLGTYWLVKPRMSSQVHATVATVA